MILESRYKPAWWLRNAHLQTIVAAKLRKHQTLRLTPERLELPDGDFVDLLWSKKSTGPVVCIFHGLAGSIRSSYINGIIPVLEAQGYRPVFMHFRGCSGEPNRLRSSYHSGHTDDIRFLVNTLSRRKAATEIHAIGYSLGGNALLKYLGEDGDECPLSSAIAVSPPLLLSEGANRMSRGWSKIYQRYLIGLIRDAHEKKRLESPALDLPEATSVLTNFWQFDDHITAPLNGFKDVHDYYTRCSSRQFLTSIRTKTHILFGRDDPFFTEKVLPAAAELSSSVTLELSRKGGHVAFITGAIPFRPRYWLEQRIMTLLDNVARNKPVD